MKSLMTSAALTLALCLPAQAGPQEDIDYIVEQTVTRDLFEAALHTQRGMIISATQAQLAAKDVTISDPEQFFDIFVDEWIEAFTDSMRAQTGTLYRDLFSDQELADIAEFYATPSGQAMIRQTPQLMKDAGALGQRAGIAAMETVGPRLARRLKAEGVEIGTQSQMQKLLDALK